MRKIKGYIVNQDNVIKGELFEGDRILRKNSMDLIEINKNVPYGKHFIHKDFTLAKQLTGSELQLLYCLYDYVSYNSGILAHDNGKIITLPYLANEFNLSYDRVRKIILSLIQKQILGKHRTGNKYCYLMNPYIYHRGKMVNVTLVKLFENTKWARK